MELKRYTGQDTGVTSLEDFAQNFSDTIPGVSLDLIAKWKHIAGRLVEKNIPDFKKAGELVLAARINGIGPQIGALLECLDISGERDLLQADFVSLQGYMPFLQKEQFDSWISQAMNLLRDQGQARCQLCEDLISAADDQDRSGMVSMLRAIKSNIVSVNAGAINGSRAQLTQTLRTKKTEVLDGLLSSPHTGAPLIREGIRRCYDQAFELAANRLAEQGSGFLSSVLDGLSGCLENPQSLAGIAETLGINDLVPGHNSLVVRSSNTNFVLGRGSEGTAILNLTEDDSTKELRFDTITSNVNWIILGEQSFTAIIGGTSQTLDFKVVVPVGMMAGSYQGTINIPATQYIKGTNQPSRDSDQTRTVTIDLQVLAGNMSVNTGDLDFGALDQGESRELNFDVHAMGSSALTNISVQAQGDNASWLTVTPVSVAEITGGQTSVVNVRVNVPDNRHTWGDHRWRIEVRADEGGTQRLINVNARVSVDRAGWWWLFLILLILAFIALLVACVVAILAFLELILTIPALGVVISLCASTLTALIAMINWVIM